MKRTCIVKGLLLLNTAFHITLSTATDSEQMLTSPSVSKAQKEVHKGAYYKQASFETLKGFALVSADVKASDEIFNRISQGVVEGKSLKDFPLEKFFSLKDLTRMTNKQMCVVARVKSPNKWPQGFVEEIIKRAQQKQSDAQYLLGWLYREGVGVAKDNKQAITWLKKSCVLKNPNAHCDLGWMYLTGKGVKQDFENARRYLQLSADLGNSKAQHNLGMMYLKGRGVTKEYAKALDLLQKSSEQGYAKAKTHLGLVYLNGWGVEVNRIMATTYFTKAAEYGESVAMYNLGMMHLKLADEEIIKKEEHIQMAIKWLERSASQGNVQAQHNLAFLFHNGKDVPKDLNKAKYWYKRATQKEHAGSLMNLGHIYHKELDDEKDMKKAAQYYFRSIYTGQKTKAFVHFKKLFTLKMDYEEGGRTSLVNPIVLSLDIENWIRELGKDIDFLTFTSQEETVQNLFLISLKSQIKQLCEKYEHIVTHHNHPGFLIPCLDINPTIYKAQDPSIIEQLSQLSMVFDGQTYFSFVDNFKDVLMTNHLYHHLTILDKTYQKVSNVLEGLLKSVSRTNNSVHIKDKLEGMQQGIQSFDNNIASVLKMYLDKCKEGDYKAQQTFLEENLTNLQKRRQKMVSYLAFAKELNHQVWDLIKITQADRAKLFLKEIWKQELNDDLDNFLRKQS